MVFYSFNQWIMTYVWEIKTVDNEQENKEILIFEKYWESLHSSTVTTLNPQQSQYLQDNA